VKAPQTRPTLDYLQRYLIEEMIEEYKDAHIPRREMVRRVLLMTGSIPTTAAILLAAGCGGNPTPTLAPTAAPKVATPAPRRPQAYRRAGAAQRPPHPASPFRRPTRQSRPARSSSPARGSH